MVIEQILRYVNEHPDAKDALEGIPKYWMTDRVRGGQFFLDRLAGREPLQ